VPSYPTLNKTSGEAVSSPRRTGISAARTERFPFRARVRAPPAGRRTAQPRRVAAGCTQPQKRRWTPAFFLSGGAHIPRTPAPVDPTWSSGESDAFSARGAARGQRPDPSRRLIGRPHPRGGALPLALHRAAASRSQARRDPRDWLVFLRERMQQRARRRPRWSIGANHVFFSLPMMNRRWSNKLEKGYGSICTEFLFCFNTKW
jgi:hypothetical protein